MSNARLDEPDNWLDDLKDADFSEDDEYNPLWEAWLASFPDSDPTQIEFGIPFWIQPQPESHP